MTGAELRSIRQSLGLTLSQFGKALGYSGNKNTLSVQIRRFESGARVIPPWIALTAKSLGASYSTQRREDLPA
jgi:transcriptional regulator with XRE-family HTH domain